MSRDNAGWFKQWTEQPEALAKVSFYAQCVAARLHAELDDCGGIPVDPANPGHTLAARMGVEARERQFFYARFSELVGAGYVVVKGSRLWVPSWAWQQRDKAGKVEDLVAKYQARVASQQANLPGPSTDLPPTSGGPLVNLDQTFISPTCDLPPTSVAPLPAKSAKPLESVSLNKQTKQTKQTNKQDGLTPDVLTVLDEWRKCFGVREQVTYTKMRVVCAQDAIKRHSVEKCIDAIRGYATEPWYHEQLKRHDVSVCLGSGGTTKDDKVLLGIEKLSEPGAQVAIAKVHLKNPGRDQEACKAVLTAYVRACEDNFIEPDEFGQLPYWEVDSFASYYANKMRRAHANGTVHETAAHLVDELQSAYFDFAYLDSIARPPEGIQEVPRAASPSGIFPTENAFNANVGTN